jgi:hypothetical protein
VQTGDQIGRRGAAVDGLWMIAARAVACTVGVVYGTVFRFAIRPLGWSSGATAATTPIAIARGLTTCVTVRFSIRIAGVWSIARRAARALSRAIETARGLIA